MYDFTHCNYHAIRSHIASVDWNAILNNLNIFNIIDLSCKKKYLYTPKYPLWFSKILK